jgi:hypothetical protein
MTPRDERTNLYNNDNDQVQDQPSSELEGLLFRGQRKLTDPDGVEDHIEQAFAAEVIACSLAEIKEALGEQLSWRQHFACDHASAYAKDLLWFLVQDGANWGLRLEQVQEGVARRWSEYVEFMTPAHGSLPAQDRRGFIQSWVATNSVGSRLPDWASGD